MLYESGKKLLTSPNYSSISTQYPYVDNNFFLFNAPHYHSLCEQQELDINEKTLAKHSTHHRAVHLPVPVVL